MLACPITVTEKPGNLPDLQISSVNPGPDFGSPPNIPAGQTVNVSYNLDNEGTSPVGNSITRVYLSTDQTVNQGDEVVAIVDNQQPGPHQTSFKSEKKFGFWYILIQADYYDDVTESVETNNVNYGFFQAVSNFNGESGTSMSNNSLMDDAIAASAGNDLSISVFPNPATDQVNIRYAIQPNSMSIQLRSIDGRRIADQELSPAEQTGNWRYDINDLPSGVYQLVVRTNDQFVSKKLIVN